MGRRIRVQGPEGQTDPTVDRDGQRGLPAERAAGRPGSRARPVMNPPKEPRSVCAVRHAQAKPLDIPPSNGAPPSHPGWQVSLLLLPASPIVLTPCDLSGSGPSTVACCPTIPIASSMLLPPCTYRTLSGTSRGRPGNSWASQQVLTSRCQVVRAHRYGYQSRRDLFHIGGGDTTEPIMRDLEGLSQVSGGPSEWP